MEEFPDKRLMTNQQRNIPGKNETVKKMSIEYSRPKFPALIFHLII